MAWKMARKVRRKIPDVSMGVEKKVGRIITFRLSCNVVDKEAAPTRRRSAGPGTPTDSDVALALDNDPEPSLTPSPNHLWLLSL